MTNTHYANYHDGEIYGIATTAERFQNSSILGPRTPIPQLYLTGADVCTPSVMGATIGGVLTASAIANRDFYTHLSKST